MTAAGHQRFLAELNALIAVERPKEKAAEVAGQHHHLAEVDHRIAVLQATLDSVDIATPAAEASERVLFGSTFSAEWEDGRAVMMTIVGPDEADPKKGHISCVSPLAKAVLGARVGDAVEVERPGKTQLLTIQKISVEP